MSEERPIYHPDAAAAPTAEVLHLVLSSRADAILIAYAARLGVRLPRAR